MTRKRLVLAAALAWLVTTVGAHAQSAEQARRIEVDSLMSRYSGQVPGASLIVTSDGSHRQSWLWLRESGGTYQSRAGDQLSPGIGHQAVHRRLDPAAETGWEAAAAGLRTQVAALAPRERRRYHLLRPAYPLQRAHRLRGSGPPGRTDPAQRRRRAEHALCTAPALLRSPAPPTATAMAAMYSWGWSWSGFPAGPGGLHETRIFQPLGWSTRCCMSMAAPR